MDESSYSESLAPLFDECIDETAQIKGECRSECVVELKKTVDLGVKFNFEVKQLKLSSLLVCFISFHQSFCCCCVLMSVDHSLCNRNQSRALVASLECNKSVTLVRKV